MRGISNIAEIDEMMNLSKMAVECLMKVKVECEQTFGIIEYGNMTIKKLADEVKTEFHERTFHQLQFSDLERELAKYLYESMGLVNTLYYEPVCFDEEIRRERIEILKEEPDQFREYMRILSAEVLNGTITQQELFDYKLALADESGRMFANMSKQMQERFDCYLQAMTETLCMQEPVQQMM